MRSYRRPLFWLGIIAAMLCYSFYLGYTHRREKSEIMPFFSPRGGCTAEIAREINDARNTILVQAYSFTSAPIAKALVDAHKRGVNVQIVLDDSQLSERYTSATFCSNAGIPTYIDSKHGIAHNKIILIDGIKVLTGSFNFSKAAEETNAENLLVITSKDLTETYTANWQHHFTHSVKYAKK